jgi:hypothetical protein
MEKSSFTSPQLFKDRGGVAIALTGKKRPPEDGNQQPQQRHNHASTQPLTAPQPLLAATPATQPLTAAMFATPIAASTTVGKKRPTEDGNQQPQQRHNHASTQPLTAPQPLLAATQPLLAATQPLTAAIFATPIAASTTVGAVRGVSSDYSGRSPAPDNNSVDYGNTAPAAGSSMEVSHDSPIINDDGITHPPTSTLSANATADAALRVLLPNALSHTTAFDSDCDENCDEWEEADDFHVDSRDDELINAVVGILFVIFIMRLCCIKLMWLLYVIWNREEVHKNTQIVSWPSCSHLQFKIVLMITCLRINITNA